MSAPKGWVALPCDYFTEPGEWESKQTLYRYVRADQVVAITLDGGIKESCYVHLSRSVYAHVTLSSIEVMQMVNEALK